MNLTPMRYKNYVWPHNPKIYGISYERRIAVHKVPFGRYFMQDMGLGFRVLRGEGEFAGKDAYTEFKKLASVFYENSSGILTHPVWQSSDAFFTKLSFLQGPTEDYIKYEFEFWENFSGYDGELSAEDAVQDSGSVEKTAYTVVPGDTLWGISNRFGVSLDELLGKNPQIKNPNLIYPGDIINI
jgi:spore coat assembly protein SafA